VAHPCEPRLASAIISACVAGTVFLVASNSSRTTSTQAATTTGARATTSLPPNLSPSSGNIRKSHAANCRLFDGV